MANEIQLKEKTAIIIAHAADWGDKHGWGADNYEIDMTDLANGAAVQSAKVDLRPSGDSNLAMKYPTSLAVEPAVAPASGAVVSVYVGFSASSTAGTGNPGGLSGAAGAYTGTAGDSLADSLNQLWHIGDLVCTSDATAVVQIQLVGIFQAMERYACFVIMNSSGQALHSDAVEEAIRVAPQNLESQ